MNIKLKIIKGNYTTTVGELIKALSKLPKSYRVITEGCDCIGNAVSLDVDTSEKEVEIRRK
jgi:hypothetical protein